MSNYLYLRVISKDTLLPRFLLFRSLLALDIVRTSGNYTNHIAILKISCDTNVIVFILQKQMFSDKDREKKKNAKPSKCKCCLHNTKDPAVQYFLPFYNLTVV